MPRCTKYVDGNAATGATGYGFLYSCMAAQRIDEDQSVSAPTGQLSATRAMPDFG
jgi:hypothetical protein